MAEIESRFEDLGFEIEYKAIPMDEWREIEKRLALLDALEIAGVDNWQGYADAIKRIDK